MVTLGLNKVHLCGGPSWFCMRTAELSSYITSYAAHKGILEHLLLLLTSSTVVAGTFYSHLADFSQMTRLT